MFGIEEIVGTILDQMLQAVGVLLQTIESQDDSLGVTISVDGHNNVTNLVLIVLNILLKIVQDCFESFEIGTITSFLWPAFVHHLLDVGALAWQHLRALDCTGFL